MIAVPKFLTLKAIWIALVAFVVFAIIYQLQLPEAHRQKKILEQEFSVIGAPSEAFPLSHISTTKPGTGYVETSYLTRLSFDSVRQYYTSKLEQNGGNSEAKGQSVIKMAAEISEL